MNDRQQTTDRSTRPADLANDARYRSSTFKLSEDGIPMRAAPAPLARRFEQICASIIAEALAGSDIVQIEFAALVFIADVPGIEQWRLAEAVGIDRNSASLVADRLERKRLVKRRINGTDRRARELHITAKGKLAFEVLWQRVRAANARILAPLSAADQALFINLLIKLIEGNSNHARPGAGRRKRGSEQAQTKREGRQ
ncbi:MAG TPA: MarR family transcriptional regulator [Bradyrhizobium sp.]|jgi:DNA-binding MarR family transcriptional regulator|nr:MarR family transcriptional regulator [Bradyrhizobium sp.]